MKISINNVKQNLALSLGSVLFTAILLEVAVRLFTVPFEDVTYQHDPNYGYIAVPNQEGRYVRGLFNQIDGHYTVNAQGFNMLHDYEPGPSDSFRVAIIGDSSVFGREVDTEQTWPQLLHEKVKQECGGEVYAFGEPSWPMSQYMMTMRYIAEVYEPDLYIVLVIVNDYGESFDWEGGRSSAWRLDPDTLEEVPPVDRGETWGGRPDNISSHSALLSFLRYNLGLGCGRCFRDDARADLPVEAGVTYMLHDMNQTAEGNLLIYRKPDFTEVLGEPEDWMLSDRDALMSAAEAENVYVLDLFQWTLENYDKQIDFMPLDPHYNPTGYRLFADLVFDDIKELCVP